MSGPMIVCVICKQATKGAKYFHSCERWCCGPCLLSATRIRTTYTFEPGVEFFSVDKFTPSVPKRDIILGNGRPE